MSYFRVSLLRLGTLLLLVASAAHGQVTFGGAQSTIPVPGVTLKQVENVVPDSSGNLYINDVTNQDLLKLTPGGVVTALVTGTMIGGVATDAAGNVYYTIDASASPDLKEVSAGGVSATVADLSSFGIPYDVVRDTQGNFYVTWWNSGGNAGGLVKITSAGAVAAVSLGSYALQGPPSGLALDTAGDLFIVDDGNRLLEVSAGGTTSLVNTGGLYSLAGVAVDAAGDLFVDTQFGNAVEELPAGGGAQISVGAGLNGPRQLALDASGNLYTENLGSIFEIQRTALDFGAVSRGASSSTWSLIYNFSGSETLTGTSVLTQGATGLDFAPVASGTSCAAGTFGSGTFQCLLNVSFTPQAAGPRLGAATLSTGAGTLITTYLTGAGTGPQIAFASGAGTVTAITGAASPQEIAVDAAGNTYVTDGSGARVFKITPGGIQSTVGSGFVSPDGIAVDGAGNVYVADSHGFVAELHADGSAQTNVGSGWTDPGSVVVDGAGNVYVSDQLPSTTQIVKVTPSGAQSTLVSGSENIGGAPLTSACSLALDASGNLYVLEEEASGRLIEIPLATGTPSVLLSGLNNMMGVAVDPAGDIEMGEQSGSGRVLEIAAGTSTTVTQVSSSQVFGSPATAISGTADITLDEAGNLYVLDAGNQRIIKFDRADAPALAFASTAYGATSAPQPVTVGNVGTSGLTFTGASIASGFQQQSSGGTDCSSSSVLSAGSACTLQLAFAPSSVGTISGSAILTDNASGTAGATQTLTLNGTGTAAVITPRLTGTVSKAYDGTTAATLAAGNFGFAGQVGSDDIGITTPSTGTYATSAAGTVISVTVTGLALTGTAAANYQLSTTTVSGAVGTITPVPLAIAANNATMTYGGALPEFTGAVSGAVHGDTFTESFTTVATPASGVGSYAIVPAVSGASAGDYVVSPTSGTLTITPAPLAVSAAPVSMIYGHAVPALAPAYTGFVNGDTAAVLTGAPALSTTATSASDAGTYPVTVAAGTLSAANYHLIFTSGALLTITPAPQTISFPAVAPTTYPATTTVVLAATATSGLPVTYTLVSGPANPPSGSTLTLTGAGTVTVAAHQAGNGNYQAAAAVEQTLAVIEPEAVLSSTSLSFGRQLMFGETWEPLTLSNPGTGPLKISSITSSSLDFGPDPSSSCPAILAAGASCVIRVGFVPQAAGLRTGTITISDDAATPQQTVSLSGTGVDMQLSLLGPPDLTIFAGGDTSFSFVANSYGYAGPVALSCAGVPANSTCTVTPASLNLSPDSSTTVTVTISTRARSFMLPPSPPSSPAMPAGPLGWPALAWLALLPLMWLGFTRRRSRRWLLGCVAGAALLAAGCGGVNNLLTAGGGTPPGHYVLTINATAGSVTRSLQVNIKVD